MQPLLFTPPLPNWRVKLAGSEFRVMRLNDASEPYEAKLDRPDAVVDYIRPRLVDSVVFRPDVENAVVINLDVRCKPIGFEILSQGTLDTCFVHPRDVFKSAIIANAAAVVLLHNHPSGESNPSDADIKLTRDLIRAAAVMQIGLSDHIILGRHLPSNPRGFHSLRELGYFY
jgi:DNA repair protein RadC